MATPQNLGENSAVLKRLAIPALIVASHCTNCRYHDIYYFVDKLKNTFDKLGFQSKIYPDLMAKDMVGVLTDVSRLDHSKYNALIVCILSHGYENFVYGVDDQEVAVRYLTMFFRSSKCKTLANKPKIFFIQACQGQEKQTGKIYYHCIFWYIGYSSTF